MKSEHQHIHHHHHHHNSTSPRRRPASPMSNRRNKIENNNNQHHENVDEEEDNNKEDGGTGGLHEISLYESTSSNSKLPSTTTSPSSSSSPSSSPLSSKHQQRKLNNSSSSSNSNSSSKWNRRDIFSILAAAMITGASMYSLRTRHHFFLCTTTIPIMSTQISNAIIPPTDHDDDDDDDDDDDSIANSSSRRSSSSDGRSANTNSSVIESPDENDSQLPSSSSSIVNDPHPNGSWPRIAWLLSFPNSGTSYTLRLVQRLSNTSAATNYGSECHSAEDTGKTGVLVPAIQSTDAPPAHNIPCLIKPGKYPLPHRYVLTKTHCGGYTTDGGPNKYIETQWSFEVACRRGDVMLPKKYSVHYDPSIQVQRAVHIIRSPFDNLVSRFHLELNERAKVHDTNFLSKYTRDPKGFQRWCSYLDTKYSHDETQSRFLNEDILHAFSEVPCHADFYRYVLWHNHAIAMTNRLGIPTHYMHYETYDTHFHQTVSSLFHFLDLKQVGKIPPFIAGKNYDGYFTNDQQKKATILMKQLAMPETWSLLERYATL